MIKLIAAVDSNFGIAKNGKIPWNIPDDLRFFREKTIDGTVAMGKNTFFSISRRPLERRINCVVSTTLAPIVGAEIFRSPEDILKKYDDFWIIGGARLYNYALENNLVDYALITRVHKNYNADQFILPSFEKNFSRNDAFVSDEYLIIEYKR
jgi:dihydrofolate reductase